MENKLYRNESAKEIGGVCAGLAEYFNIDVTLLRVGFVFGMVVGGGSFILYVILWIVLPKKYNYNNIKVDYTVPPTPGTFAAATPGFAPIKRERSSFALVMGGVFIVLGAYWLFDEFDMIPDWDLERFWPVIFIILGLVMIFRPRRDKHLFQEPWAKNDPTAPTTNDNTNTENI